MWLNMEDAAALMRYALTTTEVKAGEMATVSRLGSDGIKCYQVHLTYLSSMS